MGDIELDTPAKYVLKRLVAHAAQRLLFTEDTIDRVAEELGFGDRFYFSRVFAREAGQPPAAYRRAPRLTSRPIDLRTHTTHGGLGFCPVTECRAPMSPKIYPVNPHAGAS